MLRSAKGKVARVPQPIFRVRKRDNKTNRDRALTEKTHGDASRYSEDVSLTDYAVVSQFGN